MHAHAKESEGEKRQTTGGEPMAASNKVTVCGVGVLLLSIGQLTTSPSSRLHVADVPVAVVPPDVGIVPAHHHHNGSSTGHNETTTTTFEERRTSATTTTIAASNWTDPKLHVMHVSAATNHSSSVFTAITATTATTTTQQQEEKKNPRMVLHIGPYKHGTTFLQCSLSTSGYQLLEEDNYVYIGTCNCISHRVARTREICIGHSADSLRGRPAARSSSGEQQEQRFQPELLRILPKLHAQGRNAMIVWEYLSDIGQPWLTEFLQLLQRDWELTVIVAYRPAYEFLPSFLGQVQRPYPFRERYRTWPSKGGHAILPFDMYPVDDLVDLQVDLRYQVAFKRMKNRAVHPTEYARRLWKRAGYNETIIVIDMTQLGSQSESGGDPLLIHLFCSVLDDTPTMCGAARNNTVTGGVENARFPINYDLLAVAAAAQGLLSTTKITRTVAWAMIQQRQESILNKTAVDFPLVCPSNKSMEELFLLSVAAERTIFGANKTDVAGHRRRFHTAVQRNKFCHMDTEAVLQDPAWVAYLTGLRLVCQRKQQCRPMEI